MSNSTAAADAPSAPTGRPPARLRVVQMIGYLSDSGGAERFALGLATNLPPDRFKTWMCAPRGGQRLAVRALERAGVPFVDLGRRSRFDVYRLWRLAALLRRERIDLIHSHLFGSNLWATLLGRVCRVPVLIAHEHTWSYEGEPLRAWIDGHVIGRLTTRFVAVSKADASRMVSIEGVPAAKVMVIPTAFVPSSTISSVDLRTELGVAADTPLVGTAAVMRPQKALDVMLDAFAIVLNSHPRAHLVLAGDGPCRARLERHAARAGSASRIHFLGRRTDVDSILRGLDVAVLSSDFEGLPLFVFECMAGGTPLVATAVGGLPDVVQDGVTGVLVPPRRPLELAAAIGQLLADPDRGQRLATAAAESLEAYTIDRIAGRFAELYESLAHARTGKR